MRANAGVIATAARLRPRDLPALVASLYWLAVARALLSLRGFAGLARAIGLRPVEPVAREASPLDRLPEPTRRAARIALRIGDPFGATCLPKAVLLERALTARGVPCEILLGGRAGDAFEAHAWVEIDGNPIGRGEHGPAVWTPLARFRSARGDALVEAR